MERSKNSLWQSAASFAARAHRHGFRKDGETPYVAHVYRVAMTIRHVFEHDDEVTLAAALLHDTIEDTNVDYDEILEGFGKDVADLVAAMTKDMRAIESEREFLYDRQLAEANWRARLIKLADVFDNLTEAAPKSRTKMLGKARRAIALAKGDARLEKARRLVEALVRRHSRSKEII